MNEFALIERYFDRGQKSARVPLALGDDCALLNTKENSQFVVSVDTMVSGVHFYPDIDSEKLAQRALCVALSDLAAMAATPLAFFLALTLPEADEPWLESFSRGLFDSAERYGCVLAGGDTTRGPLAVSVTVIGEVSTGQALTRSGAREGDSIYVSGTVGDGAAALALINQQLTVSQDMAAYLLARYYTPEPQFKIAQLVNDMASACLDISDGLLADLAHICTASAVGANLALECIPTSAALKSCATQEQQYHWALSGGDDYQLCFTVPRANEAALQKRVSESDLTVTKIGQIVKGEGVHCTLHGQPYQQTLRGYQHFG